MQYYCHPLVTSMSVAFQHFATSMAHRGAAFTSFNTLTEAVCDQHRQPRPVQSIIHKWAVGLHDTLLHTSFAATDITTDILVQKDNSPVVMNMHSILFQHQTELGETYQYYQDNHARTVPNAKAMMELKKKQEALHSLYPITSIYMPDDSMYDALYTNAEMVDKIRTPPHGAILLPYTTPTPS